MNAITKYALDVLNSGVVAGEYKLRFLSRLPPIPDLRVSLIAQPWTGSAKVVSLNFPRVVCIENYAGTLHFVDIDNLHFFIAV